MKWCRKKHVTFTSEYYGLHQWKQSDLKISGFFHLSWAQCNTKFTSFLEDVWLYLSNTRGTSSFRGGGRLRRLVTGLLWLALCVAFVGRQIFNVKQWFPPVSKGGEFLGSPWAQRVGSQRRKHQINYRALTIVPGSKGRKKIVGRLNIVGRLKIHCQKFKA